MFQFYPRKYTLLLLDPHVNSMYELQNPIRQASFNHPTFISRIYVSFQRHSPWRASRTTLLSQSQLSNPEVYTRSISNRMRKTLWMLIHFLKTQVSRKCTDVCHNCANWNNNCKCLKSAPLRAWSPSWQARIYLSFSLILIASSCRCLNSLWSLFARQSQWRDL